MFAMFSSLFLLKRFFTFPFLIIIHLFIKMTSFFFMDHFFLL
jgi:hypothetical protein